MHFLGLIGLMVAIVLGGMFLMRGEVTAPGVTETNTTEAPGLRVINDAKEAANQIEQGSVGRTVTVYDGINVSLNEVVLDLSGRGLTGSLKAELRQLQSLQELDLSDNEFTGIPAEVGQLSDLRLLNLANNPVTGLPYEIGNLKKLRILDLRGTQYSKQDLAVIRQSLSSNTEILVD